MSGKFLSVEGVEGVGKTTQLEFIQSWLDQRNIEVVVTREPGGTDLGEEIRDILLHSHDYQITRDTELLLMFAARADHWHHKILPALEQGVWVLSDRFTDASYAYQGGGRGIALEHVRGLEQWILKGRRPDLTLLLDLPQEYAETRLQNRVSKDRIEKEHSEFFRRARDTYLQLAEEEPDRIKVIDASPDAQTVSTSIAGVLETFLKNHHG